MEHALNTHHFSSSFFFLACECVWFSERLFQIILQTDTDLWALTPVRTAALDHTTPTNERTVKLPTVVGMARWFFC